MAGERSEVSHNYRVIPIQKLAIVGRALRVLLGLQPLTTTAYPSRVSPDILIRRA
jgi:hypothetical protein